MNKANNPFQRTCATKHLGVFGLVDWRGELNANRKAISELCLWIHEGKTEQHQINILRGIRYAIHFMNKSGDSERVHCRWMNMDSRW
jgi:hypothetical protein